MGTDKTVVYITTHLMMCMEDKMSKTTAIGWQDVLSVAESLNKTLTEREVDLVLEQYDGEEEQDPTGHWTLIVEQCIYNLSTQ